MRPLTWGYDDSKMPRPKDEIDAEEKTVAARLDTLRVHRDAITREMQRLEWRFPHLGIEDAHRARGENKR